MLLSYNHYTGWCNNHLEKYEFVHGKDDIPLLWKIKDVLNHQSYILYIYIYIVDKPEYAAKNVYVFLRFGLFAAETSNGRSSFQTY
jgi:hypothetical protein